MRGGRTSKRWAESFTVTPPPTGGGGGGAHAIAASLTSTPPPLPSSVASSLACGTVAPRARPTSDSAVSGCPVAAPGGQGGGGSRESGRDTQKISWVPGGARFSRDPAARVLPLRAADPALIRPAAKKQINQPAVRASARRLRFCAHSPQGSTAELACLPTERAEQSRRGAGEGGVGAAGFSTLPATLPPPPARATRAGAPTCRLALPPRLAPAAGGRNAGGSRRVLSAAGGTGGRGTGRARARLVCWVGRGFLRPRGAPAHHG